MSLIRMWGAQEGVSPAALARLEALLGVAGLTAMGEPAEAAGVSEARTQSEVRLEAAQKDVLLWRNNVGAFEAPGGGWVRYGLANDSERMNAAIKSSDLIGIRRRVITAEMVGSTVGVFTARECKRPSWTYRESDTRARAQRVFIDLVNSYGGDASFANGTGTL
jgi:hypothetical protein